MAKKKQTVSDMKSKVINFYGTKKSWVKAELDLTLKEIFNNDSNEKAVVAEDDVGLYITGKSYIDAPILDPYRCYKRVKVILNEDNTYTFDKF